MPIQLLIPALVGLGGTTGGYAAKKFVDKYWRDFVAVALDDLGIEVDHQEGITDATLTKAVNKNLLAGTGVQLDSLLDAKKMKAGFEKMATQKIAAELGLPDVASPGQLRGVVGAWLADQVGAELAAQAGQLVDAAKPLDKVADKFDLIGPTKPWNVATDMTPAGISNRARQRKYRQTHSKKWVQR